MEDPIVSTSSLIKLPELAEQVSQGSPASPALSPSLPLKQGIKKEKHPPTQKGEIDALLQKVSILERRLEAERCIGEKLKEHLNGGMISALATRQNVQATLREKIKHQLNDTSEFTSKLSNQIDNLLNQFGAAMIMQLKGKPSLSINGKHNKENIAINDDDSDELHVADSSEDTLPHHSNNNNNNFPRRRNFDEEFGSNFNKTNSSVSDINAFDEIYYEHGFERLTRAKKQKLDSIIGTPTTPTSSTSTVPTVPTTPTSPTARNAVRSTAPSSSSNTSDNEYGVESDFDMNDDSDADFNVSQETGTTTTSATASSSSHSTTKHSKSNGHKMDTLVNASDEVENDHESDFDIHEEEDDDDDDYQRQKKSTPVQFKTWEQQFEKLKKFHRKHGHFQVPRRNSAGLGWWVYVQRKSRDSMPSYQRELLEKLGFNWEIQSAYARRNTKEMTRKWMQRYRELKTFYDSHGHCKLPSTDISKRDLYQWMNRQRSYKKNGFRLSNKQIDMLNELDFPWDVSV